MGKLQRIFFPRRQIEEAVQTLSSPGVHHFSLVGARFLGKTWILERLAHPEGPLRMDSTRVHLHDCAWPPNSEGALECLVERLSSTTASESHDGKRYSLLLLDNFDQLLDQERESGYRSLHVLRPYLDRSSTIVSSRRSLQRAYRDPLLSSLFHNLQQIYLRPVESELIANLIREQVGDGEEGERLVQELLHLCGGHPLLLARLEDLLSDVSEMLGGSGRPGLAHLPLIRLRLGEEYGRLIFDAFWIELEKSDAEEEARYLLGQLASGPFPLDQLRAEHTRAMNWLINQGLVRVEENAFSLFSPLFTLYIAGRLEPQEQAARNVNVAAESVRSLVGQREHQFTTQEKSLLYYFLDRPNQVVSIEELLADVWRQPDASTRRVQEGIRRLRMRLSELDVPIGAIENEWGQGYRFRPNDGINGLVVSKY